MTDELLGFKKKNAKACYESYSEPTYYEIGICCVFPVVSKKDYDIENKKWFCQRELDRETIRQLEQQLAEEKIYAKNLNFVGDNLAKQLAEKDEKWKLELEKEKDLWCETCRLCKEPFGKDEPRFDSFMVLGKGESYQICCNCSRRIWQVYFDLEIEYAKWIRLMEKEK